MKSSRQLAIALLVLGGGIMSALAQSPRVEVFAGYSFARTDQTNIPKGWNGSIAANVNRYFGIVGDVSGHYYSQDALVVTGTSITNVSGNVNMLMYRVGPKFTVRNEKSRVEPFFQALVGGVRGSAGISSGGTTLSTAANGFSWAAGAGLDVRVSSRIAIRVAQAEFNQVRFSGVSTDGLRASTGIVFRF